MAEKKIYGGRIIHKHDTEANWSKSSFIPKQGEFVIFDIDSTHDYERVKVGDGITNVNSLPFVVKTDTALSSTSENPVQNKVINAEIENLHTLVGDTTVSDQITNAVSSKAEISAGVYTATASSTDGIAYAATVPGITALEAGASFIMIPNKTSADVSPTLNVNGLGAKSIKRRLSTMTTTLQSGYAKTWISVNKPLTVVYDGTAWVVEGLTKPVAADIYGTVPQAKADANGNVFTDTYATIAMLQNMLPKVTTITLSKTWGGSSSPYYQDVALSCVTETSVVDLQPTPTQLAQWQDDGLAFTTQSGNGTVRVYVAGGLPSAAISIQVKVQEVVVI